MISTSELYKQLFNQGAIQEYKIVIGETEYIGESIYDHPSVSQRLFDKPTFTVGSFAISILNIKLRVPTNAIAKGASIKFYYRYVHGEQQSEWVQKFDGMVSKRVEFTSDVTSIEAHDRAANYEVFTNVITAPLTYPANARTVVTMIATHMGLTVDNINDVINQNIVEFPNVLTLIEVLKNIAGLSGGNFTITEDGKLKLVIVKELSEIELDELPSYPSQSHISNREFAPISRITGYFADESAFTAGNDTGSTLEFNNRWSTQNSINHIHNLLKDFRYQSAQGTKVYADPAIQLGDSFTYPDGSVQLVASADWIFDGSVTANINAPQNNEVNLDNPLQTLHDNEFKKKVSLGDPYHGITIDREKGMEMLMSPDGSPENAIGRFYANLDKGMAFQQRLNPQSPWSDFLYLDVPSKTFRINLSNEDMFKPWFAYSANANGNPMTETPQANSRYIGTSSATTRPPLYTDYVWVLIKGSDGQDGERLFMAYADTVTGDGFSLTNSSKEYFGLYIGLPPQSTNPATYAWQPSGWQASRRISELQVDLDGIRTKVEETNLGNIIPTFNMQDFSMSGWSGSGTLLYTTDLRYYEGLTYGMTALPVSVPDAMSQFGVSFFGNGEMLSPFGVRVPLNEFSFRGLVKNFKPFTITVREYSNETTQVKSTVFTFNSALSAYTFSIVPQATTRLFRIGINVPTATPASRVIFHDMMFNAGAPKQWFESANDALIYARTNITQLANEIGLQASEIDRVSGDIHNTLLSINGLRGVEIFASNGNGLTVYDTSGNKTIELTTNGTLKAVNAEISGNLSAGTFANMQFDSDGVTFPNGKLRLNSANSSIDFGSTQMEVVSTTSPESGEIWDDIVIKTRSGDINIGAQSFVLGTYMVVDRVMAKGIEGTDPNGELWIGNRFSGNIRNYGSIVPSYNNATNLGASNLRFSTIFLANQPNVSSDTRYKSDIQDIDPLLIKIFGENISPKQYRTRFDDQIHFGYIAQDVERALYKYCMAKFGENHIHQYAMLSKDESYMSLLYGEINVIMDAYTRSQIKEALS